jgi:magnesium-transporting ATPase (P-type)
MPDLNYHSLTPDEAAAALDTDLKHGLAEAEVKARLVKHGRNELPPPKPRSWVMLILRQFRSGLTQILLLAAVIAWYVGETADAVGILVAVLIDAVASLVQESRAEKAIEKLRHMVVQESTVVRGGLVHRIPAAEVAVGDLLVIEEGDRVTADARLVESRYLRIEEAALTGESVPVGKATDVAAPAALLADRSCMVWMGTTVVGGSGRAIVTAIASATEFGRIAASLVSIERPPTPLEVQVGRLGRKLGIASVAVVAAVFALGLARGGELFPLFLFAVSMTVSVIPEGLPAVMAVVLAIGVQRMARRRAVVRRLKSVDTLGAVNVICTDKTGTLTENRMTVREIALSHYRLQVTGEGLVTEGEIRLDGRSVRAADLLELDWLARAAGSAVRATLEYRDGQPFVVGDPTEGALVVLAAKAGYGPDVLAAEYASLGEVPFNSERKYRATLKERTGLRGERTRHIFTVGAFDAVADRCASFLHDGELEPLDEAGRRLLAGHNEEMAGRSLRVLAVAMREMPLERDSVGDDDVRDLTLLGLVGMIDPPRVGVAQALAQCRTAGIRVIMATGDQKATAIAIAREIGLLGSDEEAAGRVFTERETAAMDDDAFAAAVRRAVIFARVTPQTKLRLVEELERQGQTVAMTGDGVNDAPALKRATVGVAMGRDGTDVTREVADMVLTDDNFISIVGAVEEGRIIFRNVRQTTAYLFMTNFGEVMAVIAALVAGLPLPLLPAQILWMNLVTDGLPDVALATERSPEGILEEPPRPRHATLLPRNTLVLAAITGTIMAAGTLLLFRHYLDADGLTKARTVAFVSMSAFQLWNVFNMRSDRRSVFNLGFTTNVFVLLSVVASLAFQVAAVTMPSLQKILRTVPLSAGDWLLIVLVTSSVFWVVEGYKLSIRRGLVSSAWLSR